MSRAGAAGRMPAAESKLPTKLGSVWHYTPWTALFGIVLAFVGFPIWVHYTQEVVDRVRNGLQILVADAVQTEEVNRVTDALPATGAVYWIFGLIVLGLIYWRAYVDAQQDHEGKIYEYNWYFGMAVWLAMIAWSIIMVYLVVVILAEGYIGATIYIVTESMDVTILTQASCLLSNNQCVPYDPFVGGVANCPAFCFNVGGSGVLLPKSGILLDPAGCICDIRQITAARDAFVGGLNNMSGVLAGIWIMYVGGHILHHYLTAVLALTRREGRMQEILEP